MGRTATIARQTRETAITVSIDLVGGGKKLGHRAKRLTSEILIESRADDFFASIR